MRRLWLYLVVAAAIGCGNDGTNNVLQVDIGTPDVGNADAGTTPDGGSTGGDDAGDGNNGTETPRDDLELVVDEQELDFADGESGRVSFEVPDDAVSVTVSVDGDPNTYYTLADWTNGDGEDLIPQGWIDRDQGAPAQCITACPLRATASTASFAAIAPNNRKTALVPGTHSIRAYAYTQAGFFSIDPLDNGSATLRVVIKRLPQEPVDGTLDINFHFTGSSGWTADTAPDDADFQALVDEMGELYRQVNIEIGEVTYTDIGEEYQVVEVGLGEMSDLQELWSLSANQPRNALNVFLVEELTSMLGGVVLGVSGGIPGPPIAGTGRSGVVVATKENPQFPAPVANVMAHEVGHHLGLYHTSENEQLGQLHDPIDDTGESDSSLLMYHSGSGSTITPTQGEVMRRSVWVHHGGEQ